MGAVSTNLDGFSVPYGRSSSMGRADSEEDRAGVTQSRQDLSAGAPDLELK